MFFPIFRTCEMMASCIQAQAAAERKLQAAHLQNQRERLALDQFARSCALQMITHELEHRKKEESLQKRLEDALAKVKATKIQRKEESLRKRLEDALAKVKATKIQRKEESLRKRLDKALGKVKDLETQHKRDDNKLRKMFQKELEARERVYDDQLAEMEGYVDIVGLALDCHG